jgi:hypothetical protein
MPNGWRNNGPSRDTGARNANEYVAPWILLQILFCQKRNIYNAIFIRQPVGAFP